MKSYEGAPYNPGTREALRWGLVVGNRPHGADVQREEFLRFNQPGVIMQGIATEAVAAIVASRSGGVVEQERGGRKLDLAAFCNDVSRMAQTSEGGEAVPVDVTLEELRAMGVEIRKSLPRYLREANGEHVETFTIETDGQPARVLRLAKVTKEDGGVMVFALAA